jgi:hypothetical protein
VRQGIAALVFLFFAKKANTKPAINRRFGILFGILVFGKKKIPKRQSLAALQNGFKGKLLISLSPQWHTDS